MKKISNILLAVSLMTWVTACQFFEVDKIEDLNNPTVESILSNATRPQIQQVGVGVQSAMRTGYYDFIIFSGSIGREAVIFAKTESRFYTELQGQVGIDPGGPFYNWYTGFNQTRRRAEIFTRSADQSTALTQLEKAAVKGFARTVQAYDMLNLLNMMGKHGTRIEFNDLQATGDMLKPGPFVSYVQALAHIKKVVDEGATMLDQGGSVFPFPMARGWTGLHTPAMFRKFNRAVAARVAMYQQDWTGMNRALEQSFMNLTGNINTGPTYNFSTTAGDLLNPFFQSLDEASRPLAVQVNFVPEAEPGDTRVFGKSIREGGTAKVRKRTVGVTLGQYPVSEYEHQQYATNTADVPIIRNEELILMYAEAMLQIDKLGEAVKALDKVRSSHGLKPLAEAKPTVGSSKTSLLDELLNQRRYSLFLEGHRWFDMRRYDRLNSLPRDLPTHTVIDAYPIPQTERDWDGAHK